MRRSETIHIDRGLSADNMALAFVHEVNHAHSPDEPDPFTLGRASYVDACLREEAHSITQAIMHNQQLQRVRGGGRKVNLQAAYEGAYWRAVTAEDNARLALRRPPLDAPQRQRIGRRAGLARVLAGIRHGEVRTSTGDRTFAGHYRADWDEANSP